MKQKYHYQEGRPSTMRAAILASVSVFIWMTILPVESRAESIPSKVGQCVITKVSEIGTRLEGIPDSGTSITFSNGISLVSYDAVPQAVASKPGDRVRMCLESVPQDCPPGDERGKIYSVTNLRTKKKFTLPDSQHQCGGA
jgi:hypothetical protein